MGKSKVYFLPYAEGKNLNEGIRRVFQETRFFDVIPYRRTVGIKVHFGEAGRENYLKPEYVREFSLIAGEKGLQPILLETATLYRGLRQEAKTHFEIACEHGFILSKVLAPILFVDGKRGESYYQIDGMKIGAKLKRISSLINLAHFKGHFVTCFGGALKNIGMGLAAKGGKLEMHSVSIPYIDKEKCNECGICANYCPHSAIQIYKGKYLITVACAGCAGCLTICPHQAININWNSSSQELLVKIAEYASAILKDRHCIHFNFLIDITPNCDCFPKTEEPIMPDIGILASTDPVALDQASYDKTKDKLNALYPHLKPETILEKAESLGLGQREYELITL